MATLLATAIPALVLLAAAALKLAAPRVSQDALTSFGLRSARSRAAAWALVVAAEISLGLGVLLGSRPAAYGAAGLTLVFAGGLALALARGRNDLPCGCFGPSSRIRPVAVWRNLFLAGAFLAVAQLEREPMSSDEWLGAGLVLGLVAIAALTVAVFALARQVGDLRMRLAPSPALDIEHEGPEVGGRTWLAERFDHRPGARYALAVFSSSSCPLCAAVAPAVETLARDPLITVHTFDEAADAEVWQELDIPGAPYAVALGLDGTVLGKGTFNTLAQLESIVGAGERRQREAVGA